MPRATSNRRAGRPAYRPVPAPDSTRHEVMIDGTPTRYWSYGPSAATGPIVLVHGFRGDHHGLEQLVANLDGHAIIAADLPGFGESAPFRSGAHDVAAYARWLTAFVAAVAPSGRPAIVGHSFGSVVVAAALADGLAASAAVLINPIAAPALSGPRGVLTRLAVGYYELGRRLPDRPGRGLLASRVVVRGLSMIMAKTRDRRLRRWIHDQHDRWFSGYADRRVVTEAFAASVSHDVSQFAGAIGVPVLLIGADADDITSADATRALPDRFADAELIMINDVGHLVHYEAPEQAATAIGRFLARRHDRAG